MDSMLLKGLFRHAVTAGTTAVAADGLLSADMIQSAVGAVMTLVNVGWFVWDRVKERRAS